MEGAFLEMPEGWLFGLDLPVRVTRGKPLGMIDPGGHAQHRGAALCSDATPSYFVTGTFRGYYYAGINMLSNVFRELFHHRLRIELG